VAQTQTGNWFNVIPPVAHGVHDVFKRSPSEAFSHFTGGEVFGFSNIKTLQKAITAIGADLNSQYLLSYSPNPKTRSEPGFHTIRVVVNRPGLQIRTRPGYWWGGGQQ
jgi:VWFA-related protein